MTLVDVRNLLDRRPRIPFRVVTTLGDTYEVRHPDLVMVGIRSVAIGVPSDQNHNAHGRMHIVSYQHEVRLEPADEQAQR